MFNNLIFFIIAYLFGSFPSAWLIVRIASKEDIRGHGSGNVGALNTLRVTKKKWAGAAALLLDLLKGALPAWYVVSTYGQQYPLIWVVTAGLILGHSFPVWLKFKGGRGLAVAAGAMIFFQPVIIAAWIGIWLFFYLIIRKHIIASLIAAFALPLLVFFMLDIYFTENVLLLTLITMMMVFQRHLERIPDEVEQKRKAIQNEVKNGS